MDRPPALQGFRTVLTPRAMLGATPHDFTCAYEAVIYVREHHRDGLGFRFVPAPTERLMASVMRIAAALLIIPRCYDRPLPGSASPHAANLLPTAPSEGQRRPVVPRERSQARDHLPADTASLDHPAGNRRDGRGQCGRIRCGLWTKEKRRTPYALFQCIRSAILIASVFARKPELSPCLAKRDGGARWL